MGGGGGGGVETKAGNGKCSKTSQQKTTTRVYTIALPPRPRTDRFPVPWLDVHHGRAAGQGRQLRRTQSRRWWPLASCSCVWPLPARSLASTRRRPVAASIDKSIGGTDDDRGVQLGVGPLWCHVLSLRQEGDSPCLSKRHSSAFDWPRQRSAGLGPLQLLTERPKRRGATPSTPSILALRLANGKTDGTTDQLISASE